MNKDELLTYKAMAIGWFSVISVLLFLSGMNPIYAIGGGIFAVLVFVVIPYMVMSIVDFFNRD